MNSKKKTIKKYDSFEQWKSELFPNLTETEKFNSLKKDIKEVGITLANKSIEEVLNMHSAR